jgi:hypothetical protein
MNRMGWRVWLSFYPVYPVHLVKSSFRFIRGEKTAQFGGHQIAP